MSNGIITPGREWTAKLDEVKYVYRDVDFVSFANHKLTLKNKFAFTNLSDYQLVWSISGRGAGESNLAHGAAERPAVQAGRNQRSGNSVRRERSG